MYKILKLMDMIKYIKKFKHFIFLMFFAFSIGAGQIFLIGTTFNLWANITYFLFLCLNWYNCFNIYNKFLSLMKSTIELETRILKDCRDEKLTQEEKNSLINYLFKKNK